jgi:hypothetical protein
MTVVHVLLLENSLEDVRPATASVSAALPTAPVIDVRGVHEHRVDRHAIGAGFVEVTPHAKATSLTLVHLDIDADTDAVAGRALRSRSVEIG